MLQKPAATLNVDGCMSARFVNSVCLLHARYVMVSHLACYKISLYSYIHRSIYCLSLLPITEWLHRKGMPRTLSLLLIYCLFFGGIGWGFIKGFLF